MSTERYSSFEAFWPYYVSEHRHPTCRALHYIGTTCAITCVIAGAVRGEAGWFGAAAFSGYFFAWVGHFFVEKNRPATFRYPLWSLVADFKMYALALRGEMRDEVARCCDADGGGTAR